MAEHTITCADCGRDYATKRQNTKYCRVCRVFRDVMFVAATTAECSVCDEEFAPINAREQFVCGGCDPNHRRTDASGDCAICGVHSEYLLHDDIAVCRRCATTPEKRKLFVKALAKKRASHR